MNLQINDCEFTFASEFRQNNERTEILISQVHDPKGECTGQASKLKHKLLILFIHDIKELVSLFNVINKTFH